MANLKGLMAEKAAHDTLWWEQKIEPFMDETERLRSILRALKSGELELWQIEPAEHGGIDVVPAPNPIPAASAPAPTPNGTKDAKPEKAGAEVKS